MPFLIASVAWPWVASVVLVMLAIAITAPRRRKSARLPPGPTPLPVIGNIFDFPRSHLGREFAALSRKFGDVVHLSMLGQDIIILGTLQTAHDLLDKRSSNYSNRMSSVMVPLAGYDCLTVFMNCGPRLRQHRRAIHSVTIPEIFSQYESIQMDVARNFVEIILRKPQDLASHIGFAVASTILGVTYGFDAREPNDKYYEMVERMRDIADIITTPGNFLVEAFPILGYLPAWFPGGGFKTWAADAKWDILHISESLFDEAKHEAIKDSSRSSIVHNILQDRASQGKTSEELEQMCKEVAVTAYLGGADTQTVTMGMFFFAMALYPEVQKKAQQEIDAVVGTGRLPEFADRPSLPYVNAVIAELLRWHPPLPMGIPHGVVADDEYNGYLIPGGAAVFVNLWAILRDPEVYGRPEEFVPERFLDAAGNLDVRGRDPADVVFGFGRRVCPGRPIAESTLFILIASVLSAFEIGPPVVGEGGPPVEFRWEATDNRLVSHPKIHEYSIKPRSSHVGRLVEMMGTK